MWATWNRPQEGLFGLREWEDQGFVPDAVPGHPQPQPLTLRGMHFELSRVSGCLYPVTVYNTQPEHLHLKGTCSQ